MFHKLKYKICSKYLQDSDIEIREKENGFTNIIIRYPGQKNVIVLHPVAEKDAPDREAGFEMENIPPLLRYIAKG